jgi:hypothetical protein
MDDTLHGIFDIIYKANNNGIDDTEKDRIQENGLHLSYFDTKQYIVDIINSYKKSSDILQQFRIDYPRQVITINNKAYEYIKFKEELHYNLAKYGYDKCFIINRNYLSCKLFILLLCCQSSFAFPYQSLINTYNLSADSNILVNKKNVDNIYISIQISKDTFLVELKTYMKIINIDTAETIKNITINLIFDLIPIKINNLPLAIFSWTLSD